MTVLVDTSFLLAIFNPGEVNHKASRETLRETKGIVYLPAPVAPELFYMAAARVHYVAALRAFEALQGDPFQITDLTQVDMARMREIMRRYEDNAFDFVDAAIMALAERFLIDTVYTFDQRDFRVFIPKHRRYLNLLP